MSVILKTPGTPPDGTSLSGEWDDLPANGPADVRMRAFTLLEMVIVVGILVILASLAVRSMDAVDQQTRFEATQRTMQNVSDAVLSVGIDADGSPLVTGFVADVGRLPLAVGTDANGLAELWSNPRGLRPLGVFPANEDPDVLVTSGWRGGYLRLGVGKSSLLDGWGNPFILLTPDQSTLVANGGQVGAIRSLGSDGTAGATTTSGYDKDITWPLVASSSPTVDMSKAIISGRVLQYDPDTGTKDPDNANGNDLTIRYFAPNPDPTQAPVAVQTVKWTWQGGQFALDAAGTVPALTGSWANLTPVSFAFNVTVGSRVIRAYQGSHRSVPVRIALQPGDQKTRDLILR